MTSLCFTCSSDHCTTGVLRVSNIAVLYLLTICCMGAYSSPKRPQSARAVTEWDRAHQALLWNRAHTAINIGLFPCVFFFSALYYTDVASTLTVLIFYGLLLGPSRNETSSLTKIFWAIISLSMRQTNIFWVAVLPAGLALVEKAKQHESHSQSRQTANDWKDAIHDSWTRSTFYDPSVDEASIEGRIRHLAWSHAEHCTRLCLDSYVTCDCLTAKSNTDDPNTFAASGHLGLIRRLRIMEWGCCARYLL